VVTAFRVLPGCTYLSEETLVTIVRNSKGFQVRLCVFIAHRMSPFQLGWRETRAGKEAPDKTSGKAALREWSGSQ